MITKGIIKSIDLLGNTCKVHIPFFETAGNDPIIETATVSNTPGSYNGYKVGDVVYVAFEDGSMSNPVVIGKLYLGTAIEKADPRGVINVEESTSAKKATLPADSKLTADIDKNVPNTMTPYSSLSSIANNLNKLNTDVGQMDRDYGNRFKQVISSIDEQGSNFSSILEQTSKEITAKVEKEIKDREDAVDTINKNKLDVKNTGKEYNDGDEIKKYGFGWDLNDESWTIKAYDQTKDDGLPEDGLDIFKITRDTVEINAPNVRLSGYPRTTTIRYAYSDSTSIYPPLYKDDVQQSTKDEDINLEDWTTEQLNWQDGKYIWQWTQTAKYEYSETNNTWEDEITDKVICLAGASSVSFWLNCSTKVHSGTQDSQDISVTAKMKVGTMDEINDESAVLKYKWGINGEEINLETFNHTWLANKNEIKDEDLIIIAYRNGAIYQTETIKYYPLNTPVLDLSCQEASLNYDSYGENKINILDKVIIEANTWLNSKQIDATYTWVVEFGSGNTSENTFEVTDIDEESDFAIVTCNATFLDSKGKYQTISKNIYVTKNKPGKSLYKLDIDNDYVSFIVDYDVNKIEIPSSLDETDSYDIKNKTTHIITAYYGDDALDFTCFTELNNGTPVVNDFDSRAFYLRVLPDNNLLINDFILDVDGEKVYPTSNDDKEWSNHITALNATSGSIKYELYRGAVKVAVAKFEAVLVKTGVPVTRYWLNINTPVHTGAMQTNEVKITALAETGDKGSNIDSLATIKCYYAGAIAKNGEKGEEILVQEPAFGELTLKYPLLDQDIIVRAYHNDTLYEEEIITFSPINTPIIDLTNDNDELPYTPNNEKIGSGVVSSTAKVYLNGKELSSLSDEDFNWELVGCETVDGKTKATGKTISINNLSTDQAIATVKVLYRGTEYSKVFSIRKQISAASYWLKVSKPVHTGMHQVDGIKVTAMKKEGQNTETVDKLAKIYFRFDGDETWFAGPTGFENEFVISDVNGDNAGLYKEEDLHVLTTHNLDFVPNKNTEKTDINILDWETITFSPLNTPILDIENDRAALIYDAENNKLIDNEFAEIGATLYLNGNPMSDEIITYKWSLNNCVNIKDINKDTNWTESEISAKTINIWHIEAGANIAQATCTATVTSGPFEGNSYTKSISIIKQINAVTYWLKTSCSTHIGHNQDSQVLISAIKKVGTLAEGLDDTAILWWKYESDNTWIKADSSIIIAATEIKEDNIIILATHVDSFNPNEVDDPSTSSEVYDSETIPYSPLNQPIINLTEDFGTLSYDHKHKKLGTDAVETFAEVRINGEIISGCTYNWTLKENSYCDDYIAIGNKLVVRSISEDLEKLSSVFTCSVTDIPGYRKTILTKDFRVAKQIKGDSTVTYEIVPSTKNIKADYDGNISIEELTFSIIKKDGLEDPQNVKAEDENLTLSAWKDGTTDSNKILPEYDITTNTYSIALKSGNDTNINEYIILDISIGSICIDRITIDVVKDGDPAIAYWLKTSTIVHKGTNQDTAITIIPMLQKGIEEELADENAWLRYRWGTENWVSVNESTWNKGTLNILATNIKAKDLEVQAIHWKALGEETKPADNIDANIYLSETITYSPANIPVLDLSPNNSEIKYDPLKNVDNTYDKINSEDTISSSASVWIGGTEITSGLEYKWEFDPNEISILSDTDSAATIVITDIRADKATATCKVTLLDYKDELGNKIVLEKPFTVYREFETASYWLKFSSRAHSGTQQNSVITVTAMTKLGDKAEKEDSKASLYYKISEEASWTKNSSATLTLPLEYFTNKNILVKAEHNGVVYEEETIWYSPINTPVLVLSNESDFLNYDSYGFKKEDNTQFVKSIASLTINNEELPNASYKWKLDNCTNSEQIDDNSTWDSIVNGKEIKIYHIEGSTKYATATCEATYIDNRGINKTLTKTFAITKSMPGRSSYKLDIENDFVSIPTDENGKVSESVANNLVNLSKHIITAYYGDNAIKIDSFESKLPDSVDSDAFNVVYTISNYSIGANTTNSILINYKNNEFWVTSFVADDVTAAYIIYSLYRGNTKVAESKFEIVKLFAGIAATSYWVEYTSRTHRGTNQQDAITAIAWKKYGNKDSEVNNDLFIRYGWRQNDGNFGNYSEPSWGKLTVETDNFNSTDLIFEIGTLEAENFVVEDSEIITYSPIDTPILDLDNDSATLVYKPTGDKYDDETIVSSIATVFLDGIALTDKDGVKCEWSPSLDGIAIEELKNSNNEIVGSKITVSKLVEATTEFTCKATIDNKTLFKEKVEISKKFTVSKQIQGENSISYWLKLSSMIHLGENQKSTIKVTAMQKVGTEHIEDADENAKLYYQYKGDTTWIEVKNKDNSTHILTLDTLENKDLVIKALHGDTEYETETITYSPLNTPTLDLDNDTDTILYSSDGTELLGAPVSSNATLYLNGDELAASYTWTLVDCFASATEDITDVNSQTITVARLSDATAKAVCTARVIADSVFKEKEYTKAFTISKTRKGDNAIVYSLVLDQSSIELNPNISESTSTNLTGTCFKHDGDSIQPLGNATIKYKVDANSVQTLITNSVGAFEVKNISVKDQIEVQLIVNNLVVDKEVIKTVRGGTDGKDSTVPGPQGISIKSQTTYYALVANTIEQLSSLDTPTTENLSVKASGKELSAEVEVIGAIEILEGEAIVTNKWATIPPAHTPKTLKEKWKYWTTIRTETDATTNNVSFSNPIINEEVSGAYELAQGKTTNYYSPTDPAGTEGTVNYGQNIKEGDCWFQTITPDSEEYNDEYDSDSDAAKNPQGILYQWDGSQWQDIGGELVANKLTANYINALDVTAKKIQVLDSDNKTILFEANGLGVNDDGEEISNYVTIGGFTVKSSTLTTGTEEDGNKIVISGDNALSETATRLEIGENFKVLADGTVYANNLVLGSDVSIDEHSGKLNAIGQLNAISAELNHIEVKDTAGEIIFKADGRKLDEEGNEIEELDRVTIGGFSVTKTTLFAETPNSPEYIELNSRSAYNWTTINEIDNIENEINNLVVSSDSNINEANIWQKTTKLIEYRDEDGEIIKFKEYTAENIEPNSLSISKIDFNLDQGDIDIKANVIERCGLYNSKNEFIISWDDLVDESKYNISVNGLSSQFDTILADLNYTNTADTFKIVVGKNIIEITTCMFKDCKNISNVELPNSVRSISVSAFENCEKLEYVNIPNSVTSIGLKAFYACNKLKNITLPDSLTNIGGNAFSHCESLTSIIIPNNVVNLSTNAFSECYSLKDVTLSNQLNMISSGVFANCKNLESITIPAIVTTIDSGAFYNCTNLSSIVFEENSVLGRINRNAFYGCKDLVDIKFPKSLNIISEGAFYGCKNLKRIKLPDNATLIGDQAFCNCENLRYIHWPALLTTAYNLDIYNAFDLSNKTNFYFEGSVEVFSNLAAYGGYQSTRDFLTSLRTSNQVRICYYRETAPTDTTYEYWHYYDQDIICDWIYEIKTIYNGLSFAPINMNSEYMLVGVINNSIQEYLVNSQLEGLPVTAVSKEAFYNHSEIKTIILPSSVKYLERDAFYGCNALETIEIPYLPKGNLGFLFGGLDGIYSNSIIPNALKNVTVTGKVHINNGAFLYCNNLKSINLPNAISIGENILLGCTALESITLPFIGQNADGSESTYFGYIFGVDKYEENLVGLPTNLKTVTVTNGKVIGEKAFEGWNCIDQINLPNSIEHIGANAFVDTNYYKNKANWDESGVLYIDNCLIKCENTELTAYTIKENTIVIADEAFNSCTKLESINLASSLKVIGKQAFHNCSSLLNIEIPNNVTSIGEGAFSNCSSLASIEIPSNVTTIGSSAFEECSSLMSLKIPASVTHIGDNIIYSSNENLLIFCEIDEQPSSGWDQDWNRKNENNETILPHWGSEPILMFSYTENSSGTEVVSWTQKPVKESYIINCKNVQENSYMYLVTYTPKWDKVYKYFCTVEIQEDLKAIARLTIGDNFKVFADGSIKSTAGSISIGSTKTDGSQPFMINSSGEIHATSGTFSGQIAAEGAVLKNTQELNMADDTTAIFDEIVTNQLSTDYVNSNKGYYFGSGTDCGIIHEGTNTSLEEVKIKLETSIYKNTPGTICYRVNATSDKPVSSNIKIDFNRPYFSNKFVFPYTTLTIKEGSSFAQELWTVADKFMTVNQILYDDRIEIQPYAANTSLPSITACAKVSMITSIDENGNSKIVEFTKNTADSTSTRDSIIINLEYITNEGKVAIKCKELTIDGKISMTNDCSAANFIAEGNFKADGKVLFKKNGVYYEPVIQLANSNANCIYTVTKNIANHKSGADTSVTAGWYSIALPSGLSGSGISRVKGAYVTGYLSKQRLIQTTTSTSCGETSSESNTITNYGIQGQTYYVNWDDNFLYVLIPSSATIDKSISDFTIDMCVLVVAALPN